MIELRGNNAYRDNWTGGRVRLLMFSLAAGYGEVIYTDTSYREIINLERLKKYETNMQTKSTPKENYSSSARSEYIHHD